jgi:hypothetical protein
MRISIDERRALRLLDEAEPRGCTEAALLAHGFRTELLAGLVCDGLASKAPESIRAGGRSVAVARLRITDARSDVNRDGTSRATGGAGGASKGAGQHGERGCGRGALAARPHAKSSAHLRALAIAIRRVSRECSG